MHFHRLNRREFITRLGAAAAAWPLMARAQQRERMRRVGVLSTGDDAEGHARFAAFAQALEQLGWSDGRNLRIDARYATTDDVYTRRVTRAAELTGKYVVVWEKVGNEWKLATDIWNDGK